LQIRVFSSLTVSFSLPMISRIRDRASAAMPFLHRDHEVVGAGHDPTA
jgi:hypothetical protein